MSQRTRQTEVNLKIAGLMVKASRLREGPYLELSPAHRRFQAAAGDPDIILRYHYGPLPEVSLDDLLFVSGGPWSLYRLGEGFLITLRHNAQSYCLAILNRSFSRGEIYYRPPQALGNTLSTEKPPGQPRLDPFAYPLDELIMMNFLAQGRGAILHACGLVDQGRGRLFVGPSGAGKSTMANLWQGAEMELLSDDRIILRRIEGRFWIYGTPWHGEAESSSPEGAPLEKLFFLRQAEENYLRPLSPAEAAARLLACSFPPFYDRTGMAYTLELFDQVAAEIPAYDLGFRPEAGVVDFVRGLG